MRRPDERASLPSIEQSLSSYPSVLAPHLTRSCPYSWLSPLSLSFSVSIFLSLSLSILFLSSHFSHNQFSSLRFSLNSTIPYRFPYTPAQPRGPLSAVAAWTSPLNCHGATDPSPGPSASGHGHCPRGESAARGRRTLLFSLPSSHPSAYSLYPSVLYSARLPDCACACVSACACACACDNARATSRDRGTYTRVVSTSLRDASGDLKDKFGNFFGDFGDEEIEVTGFLM